MNSWRTPTRIGCGHFPDKIADFTISAGSSRAFGFEFPKKLKTLAVPANNGIRIYNDKRFAPTSPNAGNQYPEEPIHHSYFRPLVRLMVSVIREKFFGGGEKSRIVKPAGVSQYRLTRELPPELKNKLPDAKQLEDQLRKKMSNLDDTDKVT